MTGATEPVEELTQEKKAAAQFAVTFIRPGMVVGLGSGTTAGFVLAHLAALLRHGDLHDLVAVPTSDEVAAEAGRLGLQLTDLESHPVIDLTIDGADEVDPAWNLVKGGGGALLREKIVAQASRREVIVVDHTKCSDRLGTNHPLPIEVVEFGWRPEALYLESLGAEVTLRRAPDGQVFRTDEGNFVLDALLGPIEDPEALAASLVKRAGVVEVGLFCHLVSDLVVGTPAGVEHRVRPQP